MSRSGPYGGLYTWFGRVRGSRSVPIPYSLTHSHTFSLEKLAEG